VEGFNVTVEETSYHSDKLSITPDGSVEVYTRNLPTQSYQASRVQLNIYLCHKIGVLYGYNVYECDLIAIVIWFRKATNELTIEKIERNSSIRYEPEARERGVKFSTKAINYIE